MNRIPLSVTISALSLLTACATSNVGPKKLYTHKEYLNMTYCIGMSDTARYVATNKLKGVPSGKMKDFYSSKENSRLNLATVDKVYAEKFSSAWDYTVSFFNECALNLANVPSSRVNLASYCAQNSLIADVAHSYKSSGAPKEKAYEHFAKFNSKTPNSIVDKVYASSKDRAEIKLDTWKSCMVELSESK